MLRGERTLVWCIRSRPVGRHLNDVSDTECTDQCNVEWASGVAGGPHRGVRGVGRLLVDLDNGSTIYRDNIPCGTVAKGWLARCSRPLIVLHDHFGHPR